MTQANNRHGADWTKAPGDGDGPPGGGTESNRARAARGGFTFPGPALKVGESAILRLDNTGPEPVASASRDGGQTWEDAPAAPPTCALTLRWDGRVHEIPYDQADTVAQMAAKVAAATGGKVSGGTVEMPVPRRPTSAAWSGAVPGPVVSLPSTLAEAEQFYGKGSPVWAAVHARVLAGVAPPLAASAQPTPAPGQVWLPPIDASGHPPGWVDLDGTVTIADSPATAVDGLYRLTRGGTATAEVLQRGQCVGVATPHGRVMVGDGFLGHGPGAPECEVVAIGAGDSVLLRAVGGWEAWVNAGRLANPREDSRTRYAPARVGERLRCRVNGQVFTVTKAGPTAILDAADGSRRTFGGMAHIAGWAADPAQWERLDPGAALPEHESTMAFAIQMANELRAKLSPQSKVGAYEVKPARAPTAYEHVAAEFAKWDRVLSVGAADRESDVALRDRCIVADWRRAAMAPGLDTATGTALDAIASGMGIERRAAVGPSGYAGPATYALPDLANQPRTLTLAPGSRLTPLGDGRTYRFKVASAGADETRAALQRIESAAHAAATTLLRREIDALIAADVGQPFAHARAAALRAWGEQHLPTGLPPQRPAERMAALVAYEAQRGGARTPTAAAAAFAEQEIGSRTIGVYERERGRSDVQARRGR